MKDKINIAELLKDCPKGMELDCTMFDNVTFVGVNTGREFPIEIKVGCTIKYLTKEGCYHRLDCIPSAKCVIFPKGKTTWEGFQRPFNDGDIIFTHANCLKVGLGNTWISIFQEKRNGGVATYVDMTEDGKDYYDYIDGDKGLLCMNEDIMSQRLANEEEKQKLFDAIKANGYKWNAETKTLEKLVESKFKIEKGKWYICTKDLLDNYANKVFCKGDIYLSTQNGSLIPSNSNVPFKVVCASTYFKDLTIQDMKDEACCEVLLLKPERAVYSVSGLEYKRHLIVNLQRLLICRDAYWKIAGDWKPYWSIYDHKFCIGTDKDKVIEECVTTGNRILAFPTKEMRDAFYENFKEEIESCKELL